MPPKKISELEKILKICPLHKMIKLKPQMRHKKIEYNTKEFDRKIPKILKLVECSGVSKKVINIGNYSFVNERKISKE